MTRTAINVTIISATISLFLSGALFAGEIMSAEKWYRDSYAPLWTDPTRSNMDAAIEHYTPSLSYYGNQDSMMVVNTAEWLNEALASWEDEAWLRSELEDLETTKINESTYAFTTRWRDDYQDAESSYSCGWYLVGQTMEGWRITTYADSPCDK